MDRTFGEGTFGEGTFGGAALEEECATYPGVVVSPVGPLDVKIPDVKIDVKVCS